MASPVGDFDLYAYLADGSAERWAPTGLVLVRVQAIGAGVQSGTELSSIPAARAYLEGQQGAPDSVRPFDDLTDLPLLLSVAALVIVFSFGLLSNLFFGIAIRPPGILPQGTAILWLGAAVPVVASINPSVYLGARIEAPIVAPDPGGSGWIARSICQQPGCRNAGILSERPKTSGLSLNEARAPGVAHLTPRVSSA